MQHQCERSLETVTKQSGVKAFPELILNGYSNVTPLQSQSLASATRTCHIALMLDCALASVIGNILETPFAPRSAPPKQRGSLA